MFIYFPENAENYNGQQGDIWDAHQDMFLATLGALFTGIFLFFCGQANLELEK